MNRTFGVEVELPNMPVESVRGMFEAVSFGRELDYHDDGSVRGESLNLGGVAAQPMQTRRGNVPVFAARANRRFGLEVVTSPLSFQRALEFGAAVRKVMGHMRTMPSAGIHIHVDAGNDPWTVAQNLMEVMWRLERPLIAMSALRGVHRGASNNFKFCRPMSQPIHWFLSGRSRDTQPLYQMSSVLAARTATELVRAYGNMHMAARNNMHYTPHRLGIFNPYAILRKGTYEFRLWPARYAALEAMLYVTRELVSIALSDTRMAHLRSFAPQTISGFSTVSWDFILEEVFRDSQAQASASDLMHSNLKALKAVYPLESTCHHYSAELNCERFEDLEGRSYASQGHNSATDDGSRSFPLYIRDASRSILERLQDDDLDDDDEDDEEYE